MKCSFFKSITNTSVFHTKDVTYYLDRIKDGKSEKLITELRKEPDKEKKQQIKKKLPVVCFAGEFIRRKNDLLKKSSGFMVLDFDKLDDAVKFKRKLTQDNNIFACWISPSGDGVKALLRIHEVSGNDEYSLVFQQVKKKYQNIDDSGKDIARACFESYDPDIYVNVNAEKFDYVFIPSSVKIEIGVVTNIPVKDQDVISNRLMTWFKKHWNNNARNKSLFVLASAFNDFGVTKITAEQYLYSFEEPDFTQKEIDSIIKSAYQKTSQFNTKHFEDQDRKNKLKNMVLSGKNHTDIENEFKDIDKEKITQEVELVKRNIDISKFWGYNKKGEIEIKPYRLKIYLENLNYFKFYPVDNTKPFIFISKKENFVNTVNEFYIKDVVMNKLIDTNQIDVFDEVAKRTTLFTPQYLSMLDTANVQIEKDGEDYAMIYYKNCAIRVYKEYFDVLNYDELDGFVWENQIINRDFIDADHHESMFRSFIWLISGEDVERYNTFKSIIGYLLHSYKTSANNRAIILNDETVSDVPNGGSGKGIFINAIAHMKRTSVIDGKSFDPNKSFAYQTVSTDCQVLAYDDVRRNFDFERLFSQITEGLTIEYKNQGAIKLPVKDSPKILITTNYTIKTTGGSFQRRVFEVELSSYFNANYTPFDQFKTMLFDGWDEKEWSRYDQYMINCLQYYLENGLMAYKTKNLELRKFINETCQEFFEFIEDGHVPINTRLTKPEIYQKFKDENEDMRFLNRRLFGKWVKSYSAYKNVEYKEGNSNGKRWFMLYDNTKDAVEETETPF